jgi:hypothetical protein
VVTSSILRSAVKLLSTLVTSSILESAVNNLEVPIDIGCV